MQITLEIKDEVIANMMTSAIESGDPVTSAARGGWCKEISTDPKLEKKFAFKEKGFDSKWPWYANPKFYASHLCIIKVVEIDDEDTGHETVHHMTLDSIRRGLAKMAEVFPHAFAQVVEDNTDAPCADCFLQATLFGKEKYA